MDFLHQRIFDPILQSPAASEKLKQGVRLTIMRMEQRDAVGMIQYYWSAIIGTEKSIGFAVLMPPGRVQPFRKKRLRNFACASMTSFSGSHRLRHLWIDLRLLAGT